MTKLQNGSVDSLRNILTGSEDAVSGLPIEFSMEKDASGIPVFRASLDDKDNKVTKEFFFSLGNVQIPVTVTTRTYEEIEKEKEAENPTAAKQKEREQQAERDRAEKDRATSQTTARR